MSKCFNLKLGQATDDTTLFHNQSRALLEAFNTRIDKINTKGKSHLVSGIVVATNYIDVAKEWVAKD